MERDFHEQVAREEGKLNVSSDPVFPAVPAPVYGKKLFKFASTSFFCYSFFMTRARLHGIPFCGNVRFRKLLTKPSVERPGRQSIRLSCYSH